MPEYNFLIQSVYGYENREALVNFIIQDEEIDIMLEPAAAMKIGHDFIAAAEAAEAALHDAFMMEIFIREKVGMQKPETLGSFLKEFRESGESP